MRDLTKAGKMLPNVSTLVPIGFKAFPNEKKNLCQIFIERSQINGYVGVRLSMKQKKTSQLIQNENS